MIAYGAAPAAPAPLAQGDAPLGPEGRMWLAVGLSVVGGLFVGKWGFDHLFVEGMDPGERKKLMLFAGGAALVGLTLWGLDLDQRWATVEGASELIEPYIAKAVP